MSFIEKMRARPEEERLAFAVTVSGGVALVLFLGWGFVFFNNSSKNLVAATDVSQQTASAAKSLGQVKEELSATVGEISTQYGELKRVLDQAKEAEAQGRNTVNLTLDEDGEVQVENVVLPPEALDFEE